jgi:hypothetical protein
VQYARNPYDGFRFNTRSEWEKDITIDSSDTESRYGKTAILAYDKTSDFLVEGTTFVDIIAEVDLDASGILGLVFTDADDISETTKPKNGFDPPICCFWNANDGTTVLEPYNNLRKDESNRVGLAWKVPKTDPYFQYYVGLTVTVGGVEYSGVWRVNVVIDSPILYDISDEFEKSVSD